MSKIHAVILLGIVVIVCLILFVICKCKRKMKIILLVGASKTGKTPTLKKNVYNRLSNNIQPKYYEKVKGTSPIDIECYPLNHQGKKVALCTAGDQLCYIKKSIIKFYFKGADVLIIAFNDGLKGKNAEKLLRRNCVIQKTVTGTPKALPTDEENNEKDCQDIIDRI